MRKSELARETKKRGGYQSVEQEAYLNLVRTTQVLSDRIAALFKTEKLSEACYNVLRILRGVGGAGPEQGGGVATLEIRERLVSRVPDVTRLVDRLVEQGFAERAASAGDRRVVLVKLTPAGQDVLRRLDGPVLELHRLQFAGINSEEVETLVGLLEKVRGGHAGG